MSDKNTPVRDLPAKKLAGDKSDQIKGGAKANTSGGNNSMGARRGVKLSPRRRD